MKTRTSVDLCSYLSRELPLPAVDKETASLYNVGLFNNLISYL